MLTISRSSACRWAVEAPVSHVPQRAARVEMLDDGPAVDDVAGVHRIDHLGRKRIQIDVGVADLVGAQREHCAQPIDQRVHLGQ